MGVVVDFKDAQSVSSNRRDHNGALIVGSEGDSPVQYYEREFPNKLYALPFFNAERRCAWNISITGDYSTDYATGRNYADEFLQSFDGTNDWSKVLYLIVSDMIRAGSTEAAPGMTDVNGVVEGFMHQIGRALTAYRATFTPILPLA